MEVLVVVLIVLVAGGAIWIGWYVAKKRRELMMRIAQEMGGRFHKDDPFGLAGRYEEHFPTLRKGSKRYAYNVVQGEWEERPFWLFDHHHETYSHNKNVRW